MYKSSYDVVIIGGGISGLMCAHRLYSNNPNLSILLLERGHKLTNRQCPIVKKKVKHCVKCQPCAIMAGMAGAGAFSDGKYIISTEYGGWLPDLIENNVVLDYIEQADSILVGFDAIKERFMPNDDLKKLCIQNGLYMQQAIVKHLGTDSNYQAMLNLINYLEDKIEISTLTNVIDVNKDTHTLTFENKNETYEVKGENIVFAVGRVGSRMFKNWCTKEKIHLTNNQIDLGVRVELPSVVWEDFSKKIYEPKILYRTKRYGDQTRMFCFNERGHVVTENTDGVLTVNGHSFRDEDKKSSNSNFALLSTTKFTEPFDEPIEYARSIAALANKISGHSVLVQRLGDLKAGQRTDEKRLKKSSVRPTLDAVPGDLSLCIPKRQLDNIVEALDALDKIAPGTANYDTLLYGVECKFYSARPSTRNFELDTTNKIYATGDGAGFTRSLSQAGANGLMVADIITKGNVFF